MLAMRKKLSPTLSPKSTMSPYPDSCPATPTWDCSSSLSSAASSPVEWVAENQIAWTAYQGCSRRMNGACTANRSMPLSEQRMWWEQTSSVCRNAILLHNVTLSKQYSLETARHLEILESAYDIVTTMLDSIETQQITIDDGMSSGRSSMSGSSSPISLNDEPCSPKRSRRFGFSRVFSRIKTHMTTREPAMDFQRMAQADDMIY